MPSNPLPRRTTRAHLPLSGPPNLPGVTGGNNRWRRPWGLGKGRGVPISEPVKTTIPAPSSAFLPVPPPMPWPSPLLIPTPKPVQSRLPFHGSLHPLYHVPPKLGPRGAPNTGPRPASSTPRTQGSLRHTAGTGEFRRQRPVLSLSSSLRSMPPRPPPPVAGTRSAETGLSARFLPVPQWLSLPTN